MNARMALLTGALSLMACAAPPVHMSPAALESAPAASAAATAGFDQTLILQGVSFHVSSANAGSMNRLRIQPHGLNRDNAVIEKAIDGTVSGAEAADLNVDGSPELYVYITSAGSGSHGSLAAYAVNRGQSLSEIHLPPLQDDPKAAKGYLGHDEFRIVESTLVRRFPVYRDGDANAHPTGGTRQIQYKLKAGEAGWILKPDRTISY